MTFDLDFTRHCRLITNFVFLICLFSAKDETKRAEKQKQTLDARENEITQLKAKLKTATATSITAKADATKAEIQGLLSREICTRKTNHPEHCSHETQRLLKEKLTSFCGVMLIDSTYSQP